MTTYQRIPPTTTACRRGHPRTPENTHWQPRYAGRGAGREYAICKECLRLTRTKKRTGPDELLARREARTARQLARVLANYVVEPLGCWRWAGAVNDQGYGHAYDGRVRRAHRVFYEQLVGPIPAGLDLDHLCSNRACVNPAHLQPVTAAQNLRRGRQTRLTIEQVREIRRLAAEGRTQRSLAKEFGVAAPHIFRILHGLVWRDPA